VTSIFRYSKVDRLLVIGYPWRTELLQHGVQNEVHSINEGRDSAMKGLDTRLAEGPPGSLVAVSDVESDLGVTCWRTRVERYFVVENAVTVLINFSSELTLMLLPANGGHR
jgi:hypothetical protein